MFFKNICVKNIRVLVCGQDTYTCFSKTFYLYDKNFTVYFFFALVNEL